MNTHLFNMILYAVVAAVLFAIFMREGVRPRVRFALIMAASMIGAAVAAAWLMELVG